MSIVRTIANYADDAVRAIAANGDDVARAAASKKIINLTGDEVSQVGNFMREYSRKPTPQLKEQILSVFTPHIERSAASLGAEGVSVQDYSQNLYLKLFESLDDACRKQNPVDEILGKLNDTAPVADDFVRMGHKSIDELTPAEELLACDDVSTSLHSKVSKIFSESSLPLKREEWKAIRDYLDGKDFTRKSSHSIRMDEYKFKFSGDDYEWYLRLFGKEPKMDGKYNYLIDERFFLLRDAATKAREINDTGSYKNVFGGRSRVRAGKGFATKIMAEN